MAEGILDYKFFFIYISESCSAKVKGTSYTFIYSLSLLYQPISRPHAAKNSIIVAFSFIKAYVAKIDLAVKYVKVIPGL